MTEKKELAVLDLMLEDMESAPELYRPTQFWKHGALEVVEDLRRSGVEQFRCSPGSSRFFVPSYGHADFDKGTAKSAELIERLEALGWKDVRGNMHIESLVSGELEAVSDYRVYLASLTAKHPFNDLATESQAGQPRQQFEFNGRRFSRSFLNYLLGLNFLKKTCDTSTIHAILEIGGGFGSLGEILLADERNDCFYIDVDIPPTAFAATWYLKQVLGEDAVGDYRALRNEESISISDLKNRYRAVVLCPWQLPKVRGAIDLFANFISFQEMEPDVVSNYLSHVDRLAAGLVLLRNIREGKQQAVNPDDVGVRTPIKGDDYDGFLPRYELKAVNTVPFGLRTIDGFHSELRAYVRRP